MQQTAVVRLGEIERRDGISTERLECRHQAEVQPNLLDQKKLGIWMRRE